MKQVFVIVTVAALAFFAGVATKEDNSKSEPEIQIVKEEVIVVKEKIVEVPIPAPMEWLYKIPEPTPSVLDNNKKVDKPVLVRPAIDKVKPIDWDMILINGVKYFEGFYPKQYYCSAGKKTIGYGSSNRNLLNKGSVTKREAEKVLTTELNLVRALVRQEVFVSLTSYQLNALTSFTFNCGIENLKRLVNGRGRLNDGNYASIGKYMPMYRLSAGRPKLGLERRRAWEVSLWQGKNIDPVNFKTGTVSSVENR